MGVVPQEAIYPHCEWPSLIRGGGLPPTTRFWDPFHRCLNPQSHLALGDVNKSHDRVYQGLTMVSLENSWPMPFFMWWGTWSIVGNWRSFSDDRWNVFRKLKDDQSLFLKLLRKQILSPTIMDLCWELRHSQVPL